MTAAQRRALTLLATPGAEAHPSGLIRWSVLVDGDEIGTIHATTLMMLRLAGCVEWLPVSGGFVGGLQRITPAGRGVAGRAP